MIHYAKQGSSIFTSSAAALVNPVNTVGVMGRGLAAEFKERFPENFQTYRKACLAGELYVGRVLVTHPTPELSIINLPTKRHYRDPSKLDWVELGLTDLRRVLDELKIPSVAIPALGCGLGQLQWKTVLPVICSYMHTATQDIWIYPPKTNS